MVTGVAHENKLDFGRNKQSYTKYIIIFTNI